MSMLLKLSFPQYPEDYTENQLVNYNCEILAVMSVRLASIPNTDGTVR